MKRRTMTREQVADFGKCEALRVTEADLKGKKGYRREHHVDPSGNLVKMGQVPTDPNLKRALGIKAKPGEHSSGYYEYVRKVLPNDGHGKLTREGHEMLEMERPAALAHAERIANLTGAPGDYGATRHGIVVERTIYHSDGTTTVIGRG